MHIINVKAVLFDMDGVITDTMPYHFRAWKKVFKDAGLKVSEREIFLREGQPGKLTVKEISREQGVGFTEKRINALLKIKEELFKKIVRRRFVPGARRFLGGLRKKGFKLMLVTGTSRHEARRILPGPLYGLFDGVVTGNDVRHGKPHPEPYLLALKKLRLRPREAVVIENAPFGILSAKRAGLACIALETSLPRSYLKGADHVFSSFKELEREISLTRTLNPIH